LDWLGSARLSATLGHVVSRDTAYSPYGEDYASTGTGIVQEFAGMFTDQDTNVLFDTPNREFDVSSGSRWLTPDPARASWNAYSYPTNPNSSTDPTGLVQKVMGAHEFGGYIDTSDWVEYFLLGSTVTTPNGCGTNPDCSSSNSTQQPADGPDLVGIVRAAATLINGVWNALLAPGRDTVDDVLHGPAGCGDGTLNCLPLFGSVPLITESAEGVTSTIRMLAVEDAGALGSSEFQGLKFSTGMFSNRGTMTLEEATDVFGPPTHSSPITDSWDVPGAKNITHYWDRPDLGGYYRLSNHYGQVGKSNWGLTGVVPPGAAYTHFGDTLYLGFAKYVDLTPIP
jgi:RHS repeat-associated protein